MSSSDVLDNIVVKPRRFQCPRCQRLFARLEHLQRHERTRKFGCRPRLCHPPWRRIRSPAYRHRRRSHHAIQTHRKGHFRAACVVPSSLEVTY
ncbi:hypothetical protein GQ53DRAFT_417993 [Thozetella sp. PMI_491]|nr:hypothetical protein GQ53DRAFT_417993 [Thozetella sp. PMI_491]